MVSVEIGFYREDSHWLPPAPPPPGAQITLPGLCCHCCAALHTWPELLLQHTQTKLVQNKIKPPINSYPIQTTGLKVVSLLCIPLILARLTNEISP